MGEFFAPPVQTLNNSVIHNPQIFVIFEPGMFGTFICSLFMKQKLYTKIKLDDTFPGDEHHINAHKSGYKDTLANFHQMSDSISLMDKTHDEITEFFKPLQKIKLGVHRLCSYNFLKIDFTKHFSNFAIILVKPDFNRLDAYGERYEKSTPKDYHTQWWAKNFEKKDLSKVPKYFIEKMSIKEKQKYIKDHRNWLDNNFEIDQKNTIVFDPDDVVAQTSLQIMTDNVCDLVGIEKFKVPFDKIQGFIDKNKKYLYNNNNRKV